MFWNYRPGPKESEVTDPDTTGPMLRSIIFLPLEQPAYYMPIEDDSQGAQLFHIRLEKPIVSQGLNNHCVAIGPSERNLSESFASISKAMKEI